MAQDQLIATAKRIAMKAGMTIQEALAMLKQPVILDGAFKKITEIYMKGR